MVTSLTHGKIIFSLCWYVPRGGGRDGQQLLQKTRLPSMMAVARCMFYESKLTLVSAQVTQPLKLCTYVLRASS